MKITMVVTIASMELCGDVIITHHYFIQNIHYTIFLFSGVNNTSPLYANYKILVYRLADASHYLHYYYWVFFIVIFPPYTNLGS